MSSQAPITVIIPTINEPSLEQVVQAAKGELPTAEIIVVGFGGSKTIAGRNGVAFLDTHQKTLKPAGINRAVRMAQHDWIIVLDADALPLAGWGQAMLKAFRRNQQLFSGSVDISRGNFWTKVYNLSSFHEVLPENRAGSRKYLPAISLGFTKGAFAVGGAWDESLVRSEDYEWTLRMCRKGVALWFEPRASILHLRVGASRFRDVWKSWQGSGYYNWLIRQKYSDILHTPRLLSNPLLVLLLAPILSIVPTLRVMFTSPRSVLKYFYLLPFVYLTKLAWCWGVYDSSRTKVRLG